MGSVRDVLSRPGRFRPIIALALATMLLVTAGCGGSTPSAPAPSAVATAAERLFEAHNKAWSESTEAGWDFEVAHNYPGYADPTAASAQALRTRMIEAGYWESLVPDLASMTADPGWIPAADGADCLAGFQAPPEGDTYVVTVDRAGGEKRNDAIHKPQRAQVHVTLLDGTLYYYIPLCA